MAALTRPRIMLLPLLSAALCLTFQVAQSGRPDYPRYPRVIDSTRDSVTMRTSQYGEQGRRRPVTEALRSSAFHDATARSMLLAARVARMRQDSALHSYDAMAYERVSAGMSITSIGRNRLIFRHEAASRVRWQQGIGAWVDVKGARTVVPIVHNDEADREIKRESRSEPDLMGAVPYYPGYEPLWVGGGEVARAQVDESEIVNPIADGAEAYYTFESGDSLSFRLPDGTSVHLRELRFRPRQPKWNLVVGSAWLDTRSGQVVRAAYRLSVPIDVWGLVKEENQTGEDDVPGWVMAMMSPMKAELSAIGVEYGLYEGRFWLPRLRVAEGSATVSFMHVPVKMEESFKYASVNGKDTLPPINFGQFSPRARVQVPDSLRGRARRAWIDSATAAQRARARASNDSIRAGLKPRPPMPISACDTSDTRTTTRDPYNGRVRVAMRVPCDPEKLEHSPDLPPSIYDKNEEIFNEKDLEALKAAALSLSAQAPLQFRP